VAIKTLKPGMYDVEGFIALNSAVNRTELLGLKLDIHTLFEEDKKLLQEFTVGVRL